MKKYFFFFSIILIIYFLVAIHNQADWDLWARLAVGKLFFATGSVLKHDIFAYTPTKTLWIDHEWLSGVVLYFIADRFGDLGLSLLKIILMFSVFLSVFKLNQLKFPEQNHYRIIYYAFFLYSILFSFLTTIQSHCFTFAFFSIWLYALELVKRGNNRLIWIFPATMLLWANSHGGFFAGLGLVFLYTVGEALNQRSFSKYILILAASTLVTFINPYGLKYWPYLLESISMSRPFLTEWQSLDLFGSFNIAFGFKIFAIFTVFSSPYMFRNCFNSQINLKDRFLKDINWSELLILVATFYVSLQHIMHNVFFIIAAASYINGLIYHALNFYTGKVSEKFNSLFSNKFRNACNFSRDFLIYGLVIIIGVLTICFVPLKVKVSNKRFPVRAVKFIEQNNMSGNLLVLFNWGSYAFWKLYPQCLVSVDGRYDGVYSEELINEMARFHYVGKRWNEFMTKYHADAILVNTDYDVYNVLSRLDDWRIVYKDDSSAVFIPVSKNKNHWIIPDERFKIDSVKFKTRIFN